MISAILIHCLPLNIIIIYSKTDEQIIETNYFSVGKCNEPANTTEKQRYSANLKTMQTAKIVSSSFLP